MQYDLFHLLRIIESGSTPILQVQTETMSLKPSLPVEILDQIFYFLRGDIPALRASADVDQSFADIVEKHLYYQITLGDFEMTAAQLSKLLVVSPHIISYIKSLRIILSSKSSLPWLLKRSLKEEDYSPILPQLLHLTTLSLRADIERRATWPHLHLDFQSSFLACIRSPTLVDVSIRWVKDFPLPLLEESPQLKRLSLIGPFSTKRISSEQDVVMTYPHLQDLTIEISFELVEWLNRTNITQLRSLAIWLLPGSTTDCIPGILTNSSKSLTYLELHSSYQGQSTHCFVPILLSLLTTLVNNTINSGRVNHSSPPLDLSVIPHLQHLYFGVELFSLNDFWISSDGEETLSIDILSTPNPWIAQSLRTLFKLSTIPLQSIILDITLRVPKTDFHKFSWDPLVDTLQQFGSLRSVELRLTQCEDRPFDYELWAAEELKSDIHLARLIDTGLLLITTRKSS